MLAALDAVSGIQYGAAAGDPELLERGLRTPARLRDPSLGGLTRVVIDSGGPTPAGCRGRFRSRSPAGRRR
ncbi:hypothetical protein GCM10009759_49620 [Kitasatospora saccharophila]|uniref:Uncharacterized protein n=1 Tax=Kitasatospora saccharophila TaxID=407973 RepID=A0ABN2XFK8_9ACTN